MARGRAAYGQGLGLDIFLKNLACDGHEARVTDCATNNVVGTQCTHSRDAGVVCQPMISRKSNKYQTSSKIMLLICS